MNRILCATDGSENSHNAEIWAGKISAKLGSPLTYIYVTGVSAEDITGTVGDMVMIESVQERKLEVLRHCKKIISEYSFNANCIILDMHNIAESIVAYAEKGNYDHIVTGTKGHVEGIENLILGSVATEIISKSKCAVTVMR